MYTDEGILGSNLFKRVLMYTCSLLITYLYPVGTARGETTINMPRWCLPKLSQRLQARENKTNNNIHSSSEINNGCKGFHAFIKANLRKIHKTTLVPLTVLNALSKCNSRQRAYLLFIVSLILSIVKTILNTENKLKVHVTFNFFFVASVCFNFRS